MKRIALGLALVLFAGSAAAKEKVRWVNDWVAGGDKATVYLGRAEGLFAAEGLEVDDQVRPRIADAVTKLGHRGRPTWDGRPRRSAAGGAEAACRSRR